MHMIFKDTTEQGLRNPRWLKLWSINTKKKKLGGIFNLDVQIRPPRKPESDRKIGSSSCSNYGTYII